MVIFRMNIKNFSVGSVMPFLGDQCMGLVIREMRLLV